MFVPAGLFLSANLKYSNFTMILILTYLNCASLYMDSADRTPSPDLQTPDTLW